MNHLTMPNESDDKLIATGAKDEREALLSEDDDAPSGFADLTVKELRDYKRTGVYPKSQAEIEKPITVAENVEKPALLKDVDSDIMPISGTKPIKK